TAHAESRHHDKYLHAGGSAVIAAGVTAFTRDSPYRFWYGFGAGAGAGLAKELIDSQERHNHFDSKDLVATLVGALAGAYLADSWIRPAVFPQANGYAVGVEMSIPLQ
ncbi:MAG TPA: hypothetical protein VNQ97_14940, partial [Burkholderiaceae bacterium]|nr:hypothetical protein [Burkholderiaceae bacterium]